MNVEQELAKHAKALTSLNNKFVKKFRAQLDRVVNTKARNLRALDEIASSNVQLDKQMRELETAIAITDPTDI